MTVYFSDLDDFGKGVDIDIIMQKYRLYFENQFPVEAIIHAIHVHCENSPVIPKVSHLKEILSPTPPRITEAQYVQACKEYERNGFNQFTDAYDLKKAYEAQEVAKRENHEIKCDKIKEIAGSAIKRIGHEGS